MRLHRFYVTQPLGEEVVIDDVSLVSQWTKVFRYTVGDFVVLFNGDGCEYTYSLQSVTKNNCTLGLTARTTSYIPKKRVTLYLSIIKKDNVELVVQKATELGVTTIVPVLSDRSEKKNVSLERLKKIAIESSEQCGRGDVPEIKEIVSLEEALNGVDPVSLSILLDKEGDIISTLQGKKSNEINIFIGPEGGYTEEEKEKMRSTGLVMYSLGNTMLRTETAAIVTCACVGLYS